MATGGCERQADYRSLGLVEVTGRVTLNQQPLAGGYVEFESADGRKAYSTTDSGGNYRLNYNSEQPGVMPGAMKVRIYATPPPEDEEVVEGAGSDLVPAKYNAQTELQATVEAGRDQSFDFDL